jgi:U3 small nucleolar RNA-associated protein 18
MSRVKQRKRSMDMQVQQPTPPLQDDEDSDVEIVLDGEMDKDETEMDLERLVFGDSAGFRKGLGEIAVTQDAEQGQDEAGATGLEGLDDADVG